MLVLFFSHSLQLSPLLHHDFFFLEMASPPKFAEIIKPLRQSSQQSNHRAISEGYSYTERGYTSNNADSSFMLFRCTSRKCNGTMKVARQDHRVIWTKIHTCVPNPSAWNVRQHKETIRDEAFQNPHVPPSKLVATYR